MKLAMRLKVYYFILVITTLLLGTYWFSDIESPYTSLIMLVLLLSVADCCGYIRAKVKYKRNDYL